MKTSPLWLATLGVFSAASLYACACPSLRALSSVSESSSPTHTAPSEPASAAIAIRGSEPSQPAYGPAHGMLEAIPSAASACGVLSIKHAPASIVLTVGSTGRVVHVTAESSLFGGPDTDRCLRQHLADLLGDDSRDHLAVVRYELAE